VQPFNDPLVRSECRGSVNGTTAHRATTAIALNILSFYASHRSSLSFSASEWRKRLIPFIHSFIVRVWTSLVCMRAPNSLLRNFSVDETFHFNHGVAATRSPLRCVWCESSLVV
jgi:hypothetical protein